MIREYGETYPVEIVKLHEEAKHWDHLENRLVIKAYNEGQCNITLVDLIDVLKYVKENMNDIWEKI